MSDKNQTKKVTVEIDGNSYQAEANKTIIQVADANGIYIPRFCYHKKLSVAANCRMCLVDVEGARRASPACATPIMEGMKIKTRSEKALQMQKDVMEFLLINHPLDCPICDQGGECELQDIAVGYGNTTSAYRETKRAVADPDLGSIISTDMTRCILCTRCVRFGSEVAGVKELGVMGRGDHSAISTYIAGDMVNSELSGNAIDLCPVGALTSKPFRFKARAWELKQYPTVSSGDAFCADLNAHVYQNKIVRTVPRKDVGEGEWIADRDRFEYLGLYSADRIKAPMIKKSGDWVDVSWEEALDFVKVAIEQTIQKDGADKIASIISESSTSEEMFLMKKLLESVGSNNIDSRVRQNVSEQGVSSGLGINASLEELEKADFIFVLGSNLRKEAPLVNYSVKKAVDSNKTEIVAWNICDYDFNYKVDQMRFGANDVPYFVLSLIKALCTRANISYADLGLDNVLRQVDPASEVRSLAEALVKAENPFILIGQDIVSSPDFSVIFTALSAIKQIIDIKGGFLPTNVNSVGATKVGVVPSVGGTEFATYKCFSDRTDTKLLLLANTEPSKDSVLGAKRVQKALENIDIVVALSPFVDNVIRETADIILPIATHYETSGSFVDMSANLKEFTAVTKPFAENKELWRVLRVLGNMLELEGFEYNSISEVTADSYQNDYVFSDDMLSLKKAAVDRYAELTFIPVSSIYDGTSLVRRADALQNTADAKRFAGIRISKELADKIKLKEVSGRVKLYNINDEVEVDVIVDSALHPENILVPREENLDFFSNSNLNVVLSSMVRGDSNA